MLDDSIQGFLLLCYLAEQITYKTMHHKCAMPFQQILNNEIYTQSIKLCKLTKYRVQKLVSILWLCKMPNVPSHLVQELNVVTVKKSKFVLPGTSGTGLTPAGYANDVAAACIAKYMLNKVM